MTSTSVSFSSLLRSSASSVMSRSACCTALTAHPVGVVTWIRDGPKIFVIEKVQSSLSCALVNRPAVRGSRSGETKPAVTLKRVRGTVGTVPLSVRRRPVMDDPPIVVRRTPSTSWPFRTRTSVTTSGFEPGSRLAESHARILYSPGGIFVSVKVPSAATGPPDPIDWKDPPFVPVVSCVMPTLPPTSGRPRLSTATPETRAARPGTSGKSLTLTCCPRPTVTRCASTTLVTPGR